MHAGMIERAPEPKRDAKRLILPAKGPCVLALTDICLKATHMELQALGLRMLINYDLPARKVREGAPFSSSPSLATLLSLLPALRLLPPPGPFPLVSSSPSILKPLHTIPHSILKLLHTT